MIELNAFWGYMPGKPGAKAVMLCYQISNVLGKIEYYI